MKYNIYIRIIVYIYIYYIYYSLFIFIEINIYHGMFDFICIFAAHLNLWVAFNNENAYVYLQVPSWIPGHAILLPARAFLGFAGTGGRGTRSRSQDMDRRAVVAFDTFHETGEKGAYTSSRPLPSITYHDSIQ